MAERVLILGGTAEAAELARRLAGRAHLDVVYSLAGRTRDPAPVAARTRSGGFGGAAGLASYLRESRIDRVVDATHPYAARMSRHAIQACDACAVARIALVRPPWERRAGDRWIEVAGVHEAAAALTRQARRALLAVGSRDLAPFAELDGVAFVVRAVEPPALDLPPERFTVVLARGPFDLAAEAALLARERIDHVVSRNSGGGASYAKIEAARAAGLPVVMIARPPPPPGPTSPDVDGVLAWLEAS